MPAPVRTAYRLYHSIWIGLDWLYPPACGGCGKRGNRWCATCQQNTEVISPPVCKQCGERLASGMLCSRCRANPPAYAALRSYASFSGPLRQALHRLKYARNIALGEAFALHLVEVLEREDWEADFLLPVPLSAGRLAERGYNQAALLARPLALATGLPYRPQALWKIRETPTQVGLTASGRRSNLKGAFQAHPGAVGGARVLVVDDVTTSGATLEACAEALCSAGACQVFALTLARASSSRL